MSQFLTSINDWLQNHQLLVATIGIPLVTFIVTTVSSLSATKRNQLNLRFERELARRLKLADFRQSWINELRNDLAEIAAASLLGEEEMSWELRRSYNMAIGRILMRVNQEEELSESLISAINELAEYNADDDAVQNGEPQTRFTNSGRELLKFEWNRLKSELDEIERMKAT